MSARAVVAQEAPPAPTEEGIQPDRPDITNGTRIVRPGLVQIEAGGLYTHAGANQSTFGSPFLARIGLTEWLEAEIGTDGLLTSSNGLTSQSGIGNTHLGAKLRLWANPGGAPVLSILPSVTVPTADASKGLGSGDPDFTVAVLTGTDIGGRGHVDVNYGIGAIGSGAGSHFAQHFVSASASVAASDNWNPYIEGFWFSREEIDAGGTTAFDGGAIYELGLRMALDGGIQVSRADGQYEVAAFGGISMIVGGNGVRGRQRQAHARPGRKARISRR
jgi:hypothetical protein